jgi:hypothetical protein
MLSSGSGLGFFSKRLFGLVVRLRSIVSFWVRGVIIIKVSIDFVEGGFFFLIL